jgi:hypothetical protein
MSLKKVFITFIMFFTMLGLSGSTFAKEAKKDVHVQLKEVDANIQAALDAIPSANADNLSALIKVANESASELSANYKFEFERSKAQGYLKKARDAVKSANFAGAEQELKTAKESFANLPKYL